MAATCSGTISSQVPIDEAEVAVPLPADCAGVDEAVAELDALAEAEGVVAAPDDEVEHPLSPRVSAAARAAPPIVRPRRVRVLCVFMRGFPLL
ncbi:hypothetical protein [Subtercola lobariae]|uniref:hypothetical protein n=1 Tax=Subtercola lobariae TaxID=1588641 RepID=UPI00166C9342|nr:hypothetical protein [Subtercola lobariae]